MLLLIPGNVAGLAPTLRRPGVLDRCGWLLTPHRLMANTGLLGRPYAVDNECYAMGDRFDAGVFLRTLDRIAVTHGVQSCRFVAAPDVVGDAAATLDRFADWRPRLAGWPVALVLQDGAEELTLPWAQVAAVFLGGTTAWKLGPAALSLAHEARRRGKWVHVGRVNSQKRLRHFWGVADSVDGSGWWRVTQFERMLRGLELLEDSHAADHALPDCRGGGQSHRRRVRPAGGHPQCAALHRAGPDDAGSPA